MSGAPAHFLREMGKLGRINQWTLIKLVCFTEPNIDGEYLTEADLCVPVPIGAGRAACAGGCGRGDTGGQGGRFTIKLGLRLALCSGIYMWSGRVLPCVFLC